MKIDTNVIVGRIYAYTIDGKYAKALALCNKHRLSPQFKRHMMFWLNYSLAHILAGPSVARETATPVYMCRRFAVRDESYSVQLEGNFWYTSYTIARQKGNLKAQIKMLNLAASLDPGKNRNEMISKFLTEVKRDLASKKQAAKPRHPK